MESLGDLIKGRLDQHQLTPSAKAAEVIYFANQLLRSEFEVESDKAKAYKYDGKNMFIAVKNASWSQEVWGMQSVMMDRLRKRFGEKVIKKIVIKNLTIQ